MNLKTRSIRSRFFHSLDSSTAQHRSTRHSQDQGEDSFHGLFSLMCLGGFFLGITLLRRLRDIVSGGGKKKSLYSFEEASQSKGSVAMASEENMTFKLYQNRANLFVKEYLLADSLIPYTSIISGMLVCKMVFDLTQLIGSNYFKIYSSFSKVQRIEWNNRAASTTHAIFITTISLYFVFCSNLFWDSHSPEFITVRSSSLSTFALGASVGYFVSDLGMILWFFPSLGGYEYVIHHLLSLVAVAYSMFSGEGQLYTFMVLISETTTPGINLRWYLDVAGMKKSKAYLINGVVIFISWLVARILLFIYMFYHVYLHFHQVEQMQPFGQILVVAVPVVLSVMNLVWFAKIIKGLRKTLAKRQ